MMIDKKGFTLIELMVVIAIIGILSASAVPMYNTYRQRARGAEAKVMLKQLADAQVAYFLENNEFYPSEADGPQEIYHDGEADPDDAVQNIANNLNITIQQGHLLDYSFQAVKAGSDQQAIIIVSGAEGAQLYDGIVSLLVIVNQTGEITYDNL
ncbi:type IV pilin protein [Thermodesulfobacteriota bacterium]